MTDVERNYLPKIFRFVYSSFALSPIPPYLAREEQTLYGASNFVPEKNFQDRGRLAGKGNGQEKRQTVEKIGEFHYEKFEADNCHGGCALG